MRSFTDFRDRYPGAFYMGTPGGGRTLLFFIVAFFAGTSLTMAWILGLTFLSAERWRTYLADFPLIAPLPGQLLALAYEMLIFVIPVAVGWHLAYLVASSLLQTLYDLPDQAMAQSFLQRLASDNASGVIATVNANTFYEEREKNSLLRVGGPGRVRVAQGNAIVTERNGRFARVLGVGVHSLGRFEYVHSVVDLRQQERDRWEGTQDPQESRVRLVTQDGIQIHARLTLTFRICTDDVSCQEKNPLTDADPEAEPTLPTRQRPYPFGENAVRRAGYAQVLWAVQDQEDDLKLWTWVDLAQSIAVEALRSEVVSCPLKELINPENQALELYKTLQEKVASEAQKRLYQFGVRIINVRIDSLELPEPVTKQLMRAWQAPRERERRIATAAVEAHSKAELELANAEQREAILRGLLEGVERAQIEYQQATGITKEVLALGLAKMLDNIERRQSNDR